MLEKFVVVFFGVETLLKVNCFIAGVNNRCCSIAYWCLLAGLIVAPNTHAAIIGAINHTHWAINRFSVDGKSGIDIVGPYQSGGGGCCYIAPPHWKPGMTVRVDWEAGEAYPDGFPGFSDGAKYDAWLDEIDAKTRRLSKLVLMPDYTGQNQCGITVHFLPCDDVKVTTTCHRFGSPNYPIKMPLRLSEPKSCPN